MAHINFRHFFPGDEDVAAAMPPQELAAPLLAALRSATEPIEPNDAVKLPNDMYPKRRKEILLSLAEAFAYLQRECLIVPYPPELHNFANKDRRLYKVARDGQTMELPAGLETYQHSRLLPKELLHPQFLGTVLPLFLNRKFDIAVFAAMKEVEVAVRTATKLPSELIGEKLMRKAFESDQLGSGFDVDAERLALSHIFAGAMGYFRNTTGHRSVDFNPPEAARVILFATELLYLVEHRQAEARVVQSGTP